MKVTVRANNEQDRQRLLSFDSDSETVVAAGPIASFSGGDQQQLQQQMTAEEMIRQAIFKYGKPTSVVPVTAADLEGVDADFQSGLVVQIQQRTGSGNQQQQPSDMNSLMAAYQQQQLMKLYRQQQQQQLAAKKAIESASSSSSGNNKQGGLLGAIEGAILGAELGASGGYGNGYYPQQQGYYPGGAYQPAGTSNHLLFLIEEFN